MVATIPSKHNQVQLELDHGASSYVPGQKCSGRVLLPATSDVEDSFVQISFIGRVKTRVSSASGQLESCFENVKNFIEVTDTLYNGRYVHNTGNVAYTFHLVIPLLGEDFWDERESPIPSHMLTLPSSVRFSHSVFGRGWCAEVEYLLEAKVISPNSQVRTAVSPILVQTGPCYVLQDLSDPSYRIGTAHEISFSSWKLLPEFHHSPASFRQRTASLFRSPSVPKFTVEIDVSHPKILQLENMQNIPFIIGATPVTSFGKTRIVPSMTTSYRYPSITIESVTVELHSKTTVRYPTLTKSASLTTATAFPILQRKCLDHRLVVWSMASDQKTEATDESISSIDIGELCNMRLPLPSNVSPGNATETPPQSHMHTVLRPSLDSANLTHKHAINWSITVSCGDERQNIRSRNSQPIMLVEGPLPALSLVEHSLPIGPAPAYSQNTASNAPANGDYLWRHEGDPSGTNGSTDSAISDAVRDVMQASKATAEAALCGLPAYAEAAGPSSAFSSQDQSVPLARIEKQKTSKSRNV